MYNIIDNKVYQRKDGKNHNFKQKTFHYVNIKLYKIIVC